MADIKKELNDIKNAVYGKEVRGAIHDGIKKINDEAENAKHQVENIQQQVNQLVVEGDSSVEAAQARVDAEGKSFPTLKERLDTKEVQFAAQLADIEQQKVDKFEMNKFKADIMNNQNKFENNVNTVLLAYLIELDAIRSIINANHANSITDGITTGLAE